jgi:PKD repeat protein
VYPTPLAGFEVQPDFLWVGQPLKTQNYSTNITDEPVWYRWDFGDGSPIDTAKNPTHMYSKSGSFNITLTVGTYTNPQCSTTITKTDAVKLENAGDIILPNAFKPAASGEPSDVVPITQPHPKIQHDDFQPLGTTDLRKHRPKQRLEWIFQRSALRGGGV